MFVKQIEGEIKNIGKDTQNGIEMEDPKEQMLLSPSGGALIAEDLEIPGIQMEIDRAVWQVERAIKAQQGMEGSDTAKITNEKSEQQR